ncbi:gliding motility-associated peptidyl-prolyl isomerase GldI [Tenacibaculum sp. UWU-22]|uniref:gliding motility-associated peptidyl-prolyl isomerase GldI n=1 Tax=Tenacibaculum sp. UWU-22 TaxID=3234187 RepID=UPI0034DAF873
MYSCKEPQARRPKTHTTRDFYKEVVAHNKRLNELENKRIANFIEHDTIHTYHNSSNGYWFTYDKKNEDNLPNPKPNQTVVINFSVADLYGNELYPQQQKLYKVDKEDFIPALQNGIKLMKEGETITFVIPSYSAFGVVGDGDKIKPNQTIKSKVTLINIK